ncbi:MAG: long-chain fatty acid--CoA ligase [Deltaproteobacteria bacterium]|nr:long-chain fatty acid--CoA ligase [Deltaproteobacteria bacterium]
MEYPWFKHYAPHVPPGLNYPAATLYGFLADTAAKHPDDCAMTFNDQDTTYGDLAGKVDRFAFILQRQGVRKGDRVALILINSPTYVISFFALMKLGAIAVNLSVGITGEELAACLNNAGAKMAITLDLFAGNLYQIVAKTPVKGVILHSVFGLEKKLPAEPGTPAPQVYADLMNQVSAVLEERVEVRPGDVAVLQYTSGSTGTPKAATLTHAGLVASVYQSDAWMGVKGGQNGAVLCVIPFFHVFGLTACLLVSVLKGYRMLLLPRMDAMDILSLTKMMEAYRPISFPAVPSLWSAILSLPDDRARELLSSVIVATSGGAPVPVALHERYAQLTGKRMMEAYGLSEASSAALMTPYPAGAPAGSIGIPLPDTRAKIMDIETGQKECAPGEIGELVVKGPQIMRGYWNNDELTSAVLRDGWFFTRDLARTDDDGFFYLVDRKDDMIISKGFNVYPGQIEDVLKQHPKVKDAAAIGVDDRLKGQVIVAVVALKEGVEAQKEELLSYCKDRLPDYRVPRTILIRADIPRDPAGKLLRRILRRDVTDA